MNLGDVDLGRLNSATKYPSILTYHEMGDRGRLNETVQVCFEPDDDLVVTEKIDGTNSRIIMFADGDYIIGSREDLLYARGDRIPNPTLGIVNVAERAAKALQNSPWHPMRAIRVYYGEVYGHGVGKNGKQYANKQQGYRLFDVVTFSEDELDIVLGNPREKISSWRQHGGQRFADWDHLPSISFSASGTNVLVVPTQDVSLPPPPDIQEAHDWLRAVLPEGSYAQLDPDAGGRAEGVVVRTRDRSKIAKLRFEDYARTLKAGGR